MPTTYAHDVFGKLVFTRSSTDIKKSIMKNRNLFFIGLQGPDILFYYKPFMKNAVNQLGEEIHEQPAYIFLAAAREAYRNTTEGDKEELMAYLYGFVCHFILDSGCHPYISKVMSKLQVSHAEIETELDRRLMLKDFKDPFRYRPASKIRLTNHDLQVMNKLYCKVSERQLKRAYRGLHFYNNITVCKTECKRILLLGSLRAIKCYDSMAGQIMRRCPREKIHDSIEELERILYLEVPLAVCLLDNFSNFLRGDEDLDFRFQRNFE